MFMPTAVAVNTNRQLEPVVLSTAQADRFYIMFHNQKYLSHKKKIEYVDVHVPSKFGAIAISKKAGHITGSLNHRSLAEAKSEAIKRCKKGSNGASCEILKWVRNGCVAAAVGNLKGTPIIIGGAAEQGFSEQTAITNCTNTGAQECRILMPEGCSLP